MCKFFVNLSVKNLLNAFFYCKIIVIVFGGIMDGIQITEPKKLSAISKTENFDSIDSAKVIITKALLLREDFITFLGDERAVYPVIPARIGIGKISAVSAGDNSGFERGNRVFPHPETACGKCFECFQGDKNNCSDFNIAGKNADGFLRDFVVLENEDISLLPPSVNDYTALFIDHVAMCDKVIDQIKLSKGEYVVIVGGDVLGIFMAQLAMYYQAVPILVDNNQKNIEYAKRAGVYYTLFADNKLEKSVAELTGARLAKKVVYMTGSNLNSDIALKLAGEHATVCFAGFGTPSLRVNFNIALIKQLNFICVTNGYGNIDSAINLLSNGACNPTLFNIPTVKQTQAMEKIKEMASTLNYDAESGMLIVDIL